MGEEDIPSPRLPSSLSMSSPKPSWLDKPLSSSSESIVVSGGVFRLGGGSFPVWVILVGFLFADAPARSSEAFLFLV